MSVIKTTVKATAINIKKLCELDTDAMVVCGIIDDLLKTLKMEISRIAGALRTAKERDLLPERSRLRMTKDVKELQRYRQEMEDFYDKIGISSAVDEELTLSKYAEDIPIPTWSSPEEVEKKRRDAQSGIETFLATHAVLTGSRVLCTGVDASADYDYCIPVEVIEQFTHSVKAEGYIYSGERNSTDGSQENEFAGTPNKKASFTAHWGVRFKHKGKLYDVFAGETAHIADVSDTLLDIMSRNKDIRAAVQYKKKLRVRMFEAISVCIAQGERVLIEQDNDDDEEEYEVAF